ncbi:MAG TPA: hypothetical protein VNN73_01800 [Blastocatellia bacterium]|nr:hypothetical protein [Blastocatellia bacterium]
MKTIETTATVTEDGKLIAQVNGDISPGEHRVVVVIDEQPVRKQERPPLNFPVDYYGPWPENLSLRREDMYDDDGR